MSARANENEEALQPTIGAALRAARLARRESLARLGLDRKMMPIVVVFQPGGRDAELWKHEGEEFVVVLEGRLLLEVEGSPPIVLEQGGDSGYSDAPRPHRWSNIGDAVTRVLSVATPATTL